MAINKVKYGNTTLIDLTGTTATADKILTGYGAYGKDGVWMNGSATAGGGIESVTQDQDGYVVLDDDEGNQIIVDSLPVTSNGTYTATTGHAYSPVTVNVANSYAAGDEGKVVSNGALVSQTSTTYTTNNTYDTTLINSVTVNVPTGITPTGTIPITSNGTYNVTNYASANVNVPDSSSSPITVRFVDYDGTVLHTYSKNEFQALTAMPANPTHSGLTAQGWNWSLSEAKTKLNSFGSGTLNIGQMYITDDGKTRFYITMEDYDLSRPMTVCFYVSSGTTVTLDWGDNSQTISATNTTYSVYSHSYSSAGNYIITLSVSSGGTLHFAGYSGNSSFDGYNCLCQWNGSSSYTRFRYLFARLKKIEIGANVSLHRYRFYGLHNHSSITIPNGTPYDISGTDSFMFSTNYNLKCLVFPIGVTDLKNSALNDVNDLLIVSYPSSYIAEMTLLYRPYDNADSGYISPGSTAISNEYFRNRTRLKYVSIPNTVTSIGTYAFQNCTSLETIVIPEGVTTIGNYAFDGCRSLKSVTIPSTVTSIGSYAFQYCTSLVSVTLPSGLTTINTYAFCHCERLRYINIPSTVTTIGTYAFQECYSLESITFPTGVTTIANRVCYGCRNLKTINILGNVISIGQYSFNGCRLITECSIPNTVATFSTGPFESCYSLRTFRIPEGVTSIPTFSGCTSLTIFYIPSTITTSIGSSIFSSCYAMKELHIAATVPPTLGSATAFDAFPADCVIYVPQGSLTAYQEASNWSTYASRMQEEPA